MSWDQVGIIVFGFLSIFFSQDPRDSWRRWAPVCGLLSQPCWFHATWVAEQWGIFAISFLYAGSWARGFYHQWLKRA
jgi:hypothetical protein